MSKLREYGHGRIMSSFAFRMVRLHSSISLNELTEIGRRAKEIFREYIIEEN